MVSEKSHSSDVCIHADNNCSQCMSGIIPVFCNVFISSVIQWLAGCFLKLCFFIYFVPCQQGHNSARERHLQVAAQIAIDSAHTEFVDHCFFSGYVEHVHASRAPLNGSTVVTVKGPDKAHDNQFNTCMESLKPLLQKQLNSFCDTVYDGECSMDGFYQPKLPSGRNGHFIGSAMFKYPWYFLQMPDTGEKTSLSDYTLIPCIASYRASYHVSLLSSCGATSKT